MKRKSRFDLPMITALLLCIVVAGSVLSLIITSVRYQRSHKEFLHQLSVATVYAADHSCLKAEAGEGAVRVSHFHTYSIYSLFTEEKPKEKQEAPAELPVLILDYGNGAILECWEVRLEDTASRRQGVFWRFTSPEGRVWMYDTDSFNIHSLLRPTALSENSPFV